MEWIQDNWLMVAVIALPIAIDVINKLTAHFSEKSGTRKVLGFVVEVLNIISLRIPQVKNPKDMRRRTTDTDNPAVK